VNAIVGSPGNPEQAAAMERESPSQTPPISFPDPTSSYSERQTGRDAPGFGSKSSSAYVSPPEVTSPYQAPQVSQRYFAAHRGGLVLTLGIISFVCNFFLVPGILALTFGLGDLKKMKNGTMDPEGHGMTLAGTILGGISSIGIAMLFLFYVVIIVIAIAAGA
jgi:hypothetical protein